MTSIIFIKVVLPDRPVPTTKSHFLEHRLHLSPSGCPLEMLQAVVSADRFLKLPMWWGRSECVFGITEKTVTAMLYTQNEVRTVKVTPNKIPDFVTPVVAICLCAGGWSIPLVPVQYKIF